jgi:hypothetical protein
LQDTDETKREGPEVEKESEEGEKRSNHESLGGGRNWTFGLGYYGPQSYKNKSQ